MILKNITLWVNVVEKIQIHLQKKDQREYRRMVVEV
jgi:hypothetical protein